MNNKDSRFEQMRRITGAIMGPLCAVLLWFLPIEGIEEPAHHLLAIGLACMLCSGWISNTATAAMMFPIALGLLEAIREMMASNGKTIDLANYKYATGLMLMTAYACSIGGVMTPIGPPQHHHDRIP